MLKRKNSDASFSTGEDLIDWMREAVDDMITRRNLKCFWDKWEIETHVLPLACADSRFATMFDNRPDKREGNAPGSSGAFVAGCVDSSSRKISQGCLRAENERIG